MVVLVLGPVLPVIIVTVVVIAIVSYLCIDAWLFPCRKSSLGQQPCLGSNRKPAAPGVKGLGLGFRVQGLGFWGLGFRV